MSRRRISDVMYTCITLHNMIILDNEMAICFEFFREEQYRDDDPVRTHQESMQVTQEIINRTTHLSLARSNVDHTRLISKSIFVTNFPDNTTSKDLWEVCKGYGTVVDVFIPDRKSKARKREQIVKIDIEGSPFTRPGYTYFSLRLGPVEEIWSYSYGLRRLMENKEVGDYSEDDSINGVEEIMVDISSRWNLDDKLILKVCSDTVFDVADSYGAWNILRICHPNEEGEF
ncbi:RNA-directed DNA polymerase, eukaryota, nucleotide-binding alpha-beta plait domain protein [Tanacetum coccineum]